MDTREMNYDAYLRMAYEEIDQDYDRYGQKSHLERQIDANIMVKRIVSDDISELAVEQTKNYLRFEYLGGVTTERVVSIQDSIVTTDNCLKRLGSVLIRADREIARRQDFGDGGVEGFLDYRA